MKHITLIVGLIALLTLVGCACGSQSTFGASDRCEPVYSGPRCLDLDPGVKKWFGDLHESIFNCHPEPMAAANPCPCK